MNKKQKRNLLRIIIAAILMVALYFTPVTGMVRFGLYLVPYLVIGYDILIKAFKGIKNRQAFDESLLMAIATIGAILLAIYEDGDYTEAIGVMLFYQIGEWFQSYAVGKSRRNISELMDIRPDYANLEGENGELIKTDPDEVAVGTTIVVASAVTLALLPPLVRMGFMNLPADWETWIYRALTFLVISCPCALVISIPLSFFAGIGGASKAGVLIKGSNYMETLSKVRTVVFDKTGTLTKGVFQVTDAHTKLLTPKELLHLAAHVERYSTHPVGASLRNAYPNESDDCTVEIVEEIAGQGIRAHVNGDTVCVGNTKLMDAVGAVWHDCENKGTIIHVAINGVYAGHIVISDKIKETSKEAIKALKRIGVKRTVMLTGDNKDVAEAISGELGLDKVGMPEQWQNRQPKLLALTKCTANCFREIKWKKWNSCWQKIKVTGK